MTNLPRIPFALILLSCACANTTIPRPVGPTRAADSVIRAALADEERLDPAVIPVHSVAVLPLRVIAEDSSLAPLGFGLAELLMTDLSRSAQLTIVERMRIHSLLREVDWVRAGLADSTGPRAGRLIGARNLVVGTLTALQQEARLDTRITRLDQATVQATPAGVASIDDILEAEKALAFRILDALGVTLTPAERAAIEQRPTRNLGALLAFSRGLQAEAELRWLDAQREYRAAIRLDPGFRDPRDRLNDVRTFSADPFAAALLSVDAINRPYLRPSSDVNEPAFAGRNRATLVVPVIVR